MWFCNIPSFHQHHYGYEGFHLKYANYQAMCLQFRRAAIFLFHYIYLHNTVYSSVMQCASCIQDRIVRLSTIDTTYDTKELRRGIHTDFAPHEGCHKR